MTTQPANEKAMVFTKHTPQCLELQQNFHAEEGSELVFCDCPEIAAAPRALPADDVAAFGASDYACYKYPGEDQQKERTAFCEGAGVIASVQSAENARLTAALAELEQEKEAMHWTLADEIACQKAALAEERAKWKSLTQSNINTMHETAARLNRYGKSHSELDAALTDSRRALEQSR